MSYTQNNDSTRECTQPLPSDYNPPTDTRTQQNVGQPSQRHSNSQRFTKPGSNFTKIRTEDRVYVDKTGMISRLVCDGGRYYLARPCGFGKTLLISVIECIFHGQMELFQGLKIAQEISDWSSYPVLRFDFAPLDSASSDSFKNSFLAVLSTSASKYGITAQGDDITSQFKHLIESVHAKEGRPCVVLIDNYDMPLLKLIDNDKERWGVSVLQKQIASVIKADTEHIHFAFAAGITHDSASWLFNDVSAFTDISTDPVYATLCGFTHSEFLSDFGIHITALALAKNFSETECVSTIEKMYGGHRPVVGGPSVLCSHSVCSSLSEMNFGHYWYTNCIPEVIFKCLSGTETPTDRFTNGISLTPEELNSSPFSKKGLAAFFVQLGYLTVDGKDGEGKYRVVYPNNDTRSAHCDHIIPRMEEAKEESRCDLETVERTVRSGDLPRFLRILKTVYGHTLMAHNSREHESNFHVPIFVQLAMMDQSIVLERNYDVSDISFILRSPSGLWVFRFLRNSSAKRALELAKANNTWRNYARQKAIVDFIGINYSDEKSGIDDYLIEHSRA